jgi:hypothetical protein
MFILTAFQRAIVLTKLSRYPNYQLSTNKPVNPILNTFSPTIHNSSLSPLLQHRPNINLISKTPLPLRMQMPIRLRNIARANLALGRHISQPRLGLRDVIHINRTINDSVRDVHTLWSELFRDRSAQRAEGEFAAGERRHLRVGFDGCGRAGED